jgi:hypothetical protein
MMSGEDILHVVVEENEIHALYTRDGRIIRIVSTTGAVQSVARLPTEADLAAAANAPAAAPPTTHRLRL